MYRRRIFELKEDPDTVVREVGSHSIFLEKGKKEVLQMAKREFDALIDTYHVPVRAEFVIVGKDEDNATMYSITDRVYRVEGDTEREMSEKGEVALGVLNYFSDKLASYSPETGKVDYFLCDVAFEEQYVYGHTKEDQENTFRLVDIDPEHLDNTIKHMFLSLHDVVNTMIGDVARWNIARGRSVQQFRTPLQTLLQQLEIMEEKGYLGGLSRDLENIRNAAQSAFSDPE